MKKIKKTSFLLAACALTTGSLVHAASGTWNVDAAGTWSNSANWSAGIIANDSTSTANLVFNITAARTVTLDTNRTIANLTINDTGATGDSTWTLAASGGSVLTLNNGINPAVITKTSTAVISAQLAGTNISIVGGSNLTVSGNNTGITGNVSINGSNTFSFGSANALGTAIISTTSGSPGFAATSALTISNNVNISGTGNRIWTGSNLTYGGTTTITGSDTGYVIWTGTSSHTGAIQCGANTFSANTFGTGTGTLQVSGIISTTNTIGVLMAGDGTANARLILSGNQTYTGSTVNNSQGTIEIRGTMATSGFSLGTGAKLSLGSGANLTASQNITGTGSVIKDSAGYGNNTILGTNNTYTGFTNVGASTLTLGLGGVINGTSFITVRGQYRANMTNLGTITTAGAVTVEGYGAGLDGSAGYGVFTNGNGVDSATLNAGSIALLSNSGTSATEAMRSGSFVNTAAATVNLGSGAITVAGQGNSLAGGQVATGSTFSNAGTVTAGSATLTSSATTNTVVNKGGTYTQTAGTTTLSGALTLNRNGGLDAVGTAGNDAAFNVSGGNFTAASLAVKGGSVSITGGRLTVGSGGATMADRTTTTIASAGELQIGGGVSLATGADLTLNGKLTLSSPSVLFTNAGTIALNAGSSVLDLGGLFNGQSDGSTYQLITGAGSTTGNFSNITGFGGNITEVAFNNVSGLLTFTAVPEPSTYGLIGAGALVAALARRRKRA